MNQLWAEVPDEGQQKRHGRQRGQKGYKKIRVGYEDIDIGSWTHRTNDDVRTEAEKHRNADSPQQAHAFYDTGDEVENVKKLINVLEQPMSKELDDTTFFTSIKKRIVNKFHQSTLEYVASGVSCLGIEDEDEIQVLPSRKKNKRAQGIWKIPTGMPKAKKLKLTKPVIVEKLLKWVGKYEATIGVSYHKIANVRHLQRGMQLPPILQTCKSIFDRLVLGQLRSATDLLAVGDVYPDCGVPKETVRQHVEDLPHELSGTFPSLPQKVSWLTHVRINGIPYSVRSRNDPFARYPVLRAKMWSSKLSQGLQLVTPEIIDGHFAKCPARQEKDIDIVLPLSWNVIMDPKYQTHLQDNQMDVNNFENSPSFSFKID
ncbi:hypothetical protein IW261DRAFT_1427646 [Armillaria novae-zelandiae]|uniref:Uncharacterized protein n=1 Tax=Armillaria novae-zelandiae TaxID=153914 RepID=A0AA39T485_9AGAR|nr:hypothetical protein IW261DRAFT_1427646 [Armillaria novae-zelandiae]